MTFEKGTSFWNRKLHGDLKSTDEEIETQMYQHAGEECASAGFKHYEISNFAKPGYQCRHNLAYWHGRGWYAVGPGAARFVNGVRSVNHRSTTTYLRRMEEDDNAIAETESIDRLQYARERAAFGIRVIEGVDMHVLSEETGVDLWRECREEIETCLSSGFISVTANGLRLTDHGILFADTVASKLLG